MERRKDISFRVGFTAAIARFPIQLTTKDLHYYKKEFLDWYIEHIDKNEYLFEKYSIIDLGVLSQINTIHKPFKLDITPHDNNKYLAKIEDDVLKINFPNQEEVLASKLNINKISLKLITDYYYPRVVNRVHQLNKQTLNAKIANIRLKNNRSNWGSYSTKGNINISTRLLFSSPQILDSVILHELSHTVDLYHSEKFYNTLLKINPNYYESEQWLKKNSFYCDIGKMPFL